MRISDQFTWDLAAEPFMFEDFKTCLHEMLREYATCDSSDSTSFYYAKGGFPTSYYFNAPQRRTGAQSISQAFGQMLFLPLPVPPSSEPKRVVATSFDEVRSGIDACASGSCIFKLDFASVMIQHTLNLPPNTYISFEGVKQDNGVWPTLDGGGTKRILELQGPTTSASFRNIRFLNGFTNYTQVSSYGAKRIGGSALLLNGSVVFAIENCILKEIGQLT